MDRLLELTVNVEIVGEAEGVKLDGGIMDIVTRSHRWSSVCLRIFPNPSRWMSPPEDQRLYPGEEHSADAKVKILTDPEIVVVTIVPPIKEEVPVGSAREAAEPEVIKKGKTPRRVRRGRRESK